VTLIVHTSQLGHLVPDGLDITRTGGLGFPFAPSLGLLRRYPTNGTDRDWLNFAEGYISEMRDSFKGEKQAWVNLLALPRVVLLCGCSEAPRCHRTILAQQILPKLGAKYAGEIV